MNWIMIFFHKEDYNFALLYMKLHEVYIMENFAILYRLEFLKGSLMHKVFADAGSRGMVYCMQFYFVLQDAVFMTRTRDL